MKQTTSKTIISTPDAPAAIGAYSQAVIANNTLYISGQIPLDPKTMEAVEGGFEAQARQVFENLSAVLKAANCDWTNVAKLNVYMTDLSVFAKLNVIMSEYVADPYPARAAVQVAALPRGVEIEIDAVAFVD
ncbi:MAG: RidA family protein [Arenicella sp.]|jgi:reactive intermediate/imine deaminase|nr:RidA family protein [Arenicella sp.]HAU67671.1 reactive intermediate/imine deaminase [Gammaproteobacteria bacterium]